MAMTGRNTWAWALGALIIGVAVLVAALQKPSGQNALGTETNRFAQDPGATRQNIPPVQAQNLPVVKCFLKDLAEGGTRQNDGTILPFVAGEILTLDAEALNATEYHWTVNGEAIKDKDQEWSRRKDREYEVKEPGEYKFVVQVRGSDPVLLSQPKEKVLSVPALQIVSFEKSIVEDGDRCLTGGSFLVEVEMNEPITADESYYKYRYWVNDQVVKHPDDEDEADGEWCDETDLLYTFPAPGHYAFKVEVRRTTAKEAEGSAMLAETIAVADAVLLSFDIYPEKYAPLGSTVELDAFPESIYGKAECRFGVKKIDAADFEWIAEADGSIWGAAERSWLPTEDGRYLIRSEIRESGKQVAEDFRELQYTITNGDF